MTAPWESHPKSWFDKLLDLVVLLPSIFARADSIIPHDPTLARRLMAQDLLGNCLGVERMLDEWHVAFSPALVDASQPPAFWIEDLEGSDAQIPFADAFAFRDSVTAVTFVYFWTALILFYPCVERIYEAIFQPVVDAYPQLFPNLPPALQIDPLRYGAKGGARAGRQRVPQPGLRPVHHRPARPARLPPARRRGLLQRDQHGLGRRRPGDDVVRRLQDAPDLKGPGHRRRGAEPPLGGAGEVLTGCVVPRERTASNTC